MNQARRSFGALFAVVAAFLAADTAPVAAQQPYSTLSRAIDAAASDKGPPSLVVVTFDEHRILWSHIAGHADIAANRRPTLNTRYRLGSMAKAITSTLLAVAAHKQLISLDSKVTVTTATGPATVTLRQAVNMQAGLAQAVCYQGITGDSDSGCGPRFDHRFAVAITSGSGRYSYSNMGPQIAARRLALALREPIENSARRLLFGPAGMTATTFEHSRAGADQATSYDQAGKPYPHDFRIMPEAGAGLEGSAQDLVRFGQLHLGGRVPGGRPLLSPDWLALLHSAPNGGFYGYGWGRIGAGKPTEVLIADGQVNGGQAMLIISPHHKVGALVLSNAAHDAVSEIAKSAIDAVAPGTAAAFAADVAAMQSAHEAKASAFLPPRDFKATGFVRLGESRLPLVAQARDNRLTVAIAGQVSEPGESSIDEGFRVWTVPCPRQVPACARPGATAKIFLSRDLGDLGGQLQVTSFNGQLPYALRLELD